MPVSDFGKISTMEQDQRKGRYFPHKNVSRFVRPADAIVQVKCFDCGLYWEHKLREETLSPERCEKDD